jgi:hypothetical protein
MLSRVCYAVPLQHADRFEPFRSRINRGQVGYTAYRTSVGSYPDFRDLGGMWAQGDYATGLLAVRKLGIDTVRGLTHLFGNTNRNPKYLGRFMQRLPRDLDDFRDRFLALHTRDVVVSGTEREAILRWLDLVDDAYKIIRETRDRVPAFPTCNEFLAVMRNELHGELEWTAELVNEYAFRAREAVSDEPTLRELLSAMTERRAATSSLPLRTWAAGRPVPHGEDNKSDT